MWSSISSYIDGLSDISIKCCIATNDSENVQHFLVCFFDATFYAYAASVYVLQINGGQESKSNLIFSRRVAPLKKMKIPRLELMVISVRSFQYVKQQLKFTYLDHICIQIHSLF